MYPKSPDQQALGKYLLSGKKTPSLQPPYMDDSVVIPILQTERALRVQPLSVTQLGNGVAGV